MRKTLILLLMSAWTVQALANEKVEIAAMQSIELRYTEFADQDVKITNNSGKPVAVSVIDSETGKQVKGFGLGPIANAILQVGENQVLVLKNNSVKDITLLIEFVERQEDTYNPENAPMVTFTLHNSSLKSIPLIIPDVMNPNLSPISNSGVALKIGQKVYLRSKSGKKLILTVDETIKPGDKIDVAKLIAEYKKD